MGVSAGRRASSVSLTSFFRSLIYSIERLLRSRHSVGSEREENTTQSKDTDATNKEK
jgi:hypothetical protein